MRLFHIYFRSILVAVAVVVADEALIYIIDFTCCAIDYVYCAPIAAAAATHTYIRTYIHIFTAIRYFSVAKCLYVCGCDIYNSAIHLTTTVLCCVFPAFALEIKNSN